MLFDPARESAACGVGFVAHVSGRRSHEVVRLGLEALRRTEHRGATGADPETGDGAGLMLQIPDRLLRVACHRDLDLDLPHPGDYAVGTAFLPREPSDRMRCEELFVRIAVEEGQRPLGWRDVPVDRSALGELARRSEPLIRHLFVERGERTPPEAFRRTLMVVRRRVELAAAARRIPEASFSIASLSPDTLTYKGLLTAPQLARYYADLADPRLESAIALFHSRFSTNTGGTWDLAQPFNLLAHNGEINTVRGNRAWMHAREPQLRSELLGADLQKVFPIIDERWSDSAALDAVLELLVMAGRSPAQALMMLVPPAWQGDGAMDDDRRAYYEHQGHTLEPWDGPAALVFSDGRVVGARLDRNGLRPARYSVTEDGLVVLASEAGVVDLDPASVVTNERLGPGDMLLVDTEAGRIVPGAEVEHAEARRRPWPRLLADEQVRLDDLPVADLFATTPLELHRAQRIFGYTREEIELVLAEMARTGAEPVGSMGVDTPLAVLSDQPRLLADYFKQHFAQVTNPAIDPERERLVMSLHVSIGSRGNLLDERSAHARAVALDQPVMSEDDLARLRGLEREGLRSATLPCLFDPASGGAGLGEAVERLCRLASRHVAEGHTILVLSDRAVTASLAPVPILLATAAVHSHLVREGTRTRCGIVVESGEPREVMHFALLQGYGAAAICPFAALQTVAELAGPVEAAAATERYIAAIGKGLLKVLARMGISTLQSYRGAALFEAVGLGPEVIARFFTGTVSRVGGIGLDEIAADAAARHRHGFAATSLEDGGRYRFRLEGERHAWHPGSIAPLQRAARDGSREAYRRYSAAADEEGGREGTVRSLLALAPGGPPVPLDEVEPATAIVRRFSTGAMSLGALSKEAHETLAVAMNRIGGRSNSGEGGEDPARSQPAANGDRRHSAIRQVASARFGVTASYLVEADVIQIKIAQGAKPGEGGQLPGHKVDAEIARLRHSTPGVGLISPPPHHDIYSIEDLAQLIYDLRCVNPEAGISVKLVAEAGVGTVALGVAKARADHITVAGLEGGTGASPLSSLVHVGLPWELGLAETQQALVAGGLRHRVRLQADGGLRTGRDVMVAALLGADEFAFSTAPLIAAGCVMMRVCHLNTCPVGIATQDPELRRRFQGTPEHVIAYFMELAEEVRELLASLGARHLDEVVGHTDLLQPRRDGISARAAMLDLAPLLARTEPPAGLPPAPPARAGVAPSPLETALATAAAPALARGEPVRFAGRVRNTDRALGAALSGEIARGCPDGLEDGLIDVHLVGVAGQSLGAFGVRGLALTITGQANDGVGKGLSGARIVLRRPTTAGYPASSTILGNTALYGATAGELYAAGHAGERFAVRNSGATAVIEGVGDHGCEYMTGGVVVVLGPAGRNFAAGMSGGLAYLYDPEGLAAGLCHAASVGLDVVEDTAALHALVSRHRELTGSPVAGGLLARWERTVEDFVAVIPHDIRRLAEASRPDEAAVA